MKRHPSGDFLWALFCSFSYLLPEFLIYFNDYATQKAHAEEFYVSKYHKDSI